GFHQSLIKIKLFKKRVKRDRVEKSEASFSNDWSFYCLIHTEFIPAANVKHTCQKKQVTL
ncbi:hypothetical protein DBR06_SOUSAS24510026, partial [Sousa chinensis]